MEPIRNESLILQKLVGYILGSIPLASFYDWLVPATWDIEEWATPEVQELVSGVKGRLAEFDKSHWAEPELKQQLVVLLNQSLGIVACVEPGEFAIIGSAAQTGGRMHLRAIGPVRITGSSSPGPVGIFNHALPLPRWVERQLSEPESIAAPA